MQNASDIAAQSVRNSSLSGEVRGRAVALLADLFGELPGPFEELLFERAMHAGTRRDVFLDAAGELRKRRRDVLAQFRDRLQQSWDALLEGRPQSIEDAFAGSLRDPLTLVTDQELESRLAIRSLAEAIRRENKAILARLDARIARVVGNQALDGMRNPVGPEHFSAAVYRSFLLCDFAPDVRLELIRLCEARLLPGAKQAYEALDAWLERAGVAADMPASRARKTEAPAPTVAVDDESTATPLWASRFLDRMGGMPASQASGGSGIPGIGDVEPRFPSEVSDPPGEVPSMQGVLLEALQYMLRQSRRTNAGDGRPMSARTDASASHRRDLSQSEMLSVLSRLQVMPTAMAAVTGDGVDGSLAQRLKDQVFDSARQLGVDPDTVRLAPGDEDAIDLVGMLFDVMLDERNIAGRSRDLIARLLVPFVKAAMLDRRLFVQKGHPARRLLNALAEACEGNDGERPAARQLLAKVEEVVDRLLAGFNESLSIFLTLEEEFRAYLEQYRRGVEISERRAAEAQRGQERLEAARTRTSSELQSRVDGASLPQAIKDFLYQPWAHHVTLTVLRDGEDSESLHEALAVADTLLHEHAEAVRHVAGKAWLQDSRPALRKIFASIGMTPEAADVAVDALCDTLRSVAEARPELERPLPELPEVALPKPAAPAPLQLVAGTDTLEFDPSDARYFRNLQIGAWLDFIGQDNKVQPCKLSWISPISSRLLFVNRRGVNTCVASPEELAVMVRLGRLRAHRSETAFDSAMQGVIDRLEPASAS